MFIGVFSLIMYYLSRFLRRTSLAIVIDLLWSAVLFCGLITAMK